MALTTEEMTVFCKKKGIAFINSEIYGGIAGFWDFGPLGVEIKNNIKQELWKRFVQQREDIVGIDSAIINHQKVWEASGHLSCFTDTLLDCSRCKARSRADHLVEEKLDITAEGISLDEINKLVKKNRIKCPKCGSELKQAQNFNLMFKTSVGSFGNRAADAYLRPETAQLIFTNFKSVMDSSRVKLPFGIAQIGKAFRNEISPRDFLFRSREFEQFEIEFFTNPEESKKCLFMDEVKNLKINIITEDMQGKNKEHITDTVINLIKKGIFNNEWLAYWISSFYKWFLDFGIDKDNLRIRQHLKKELAHYASSCFDIEYNFPTGWKEIHGNADRGQFDLKQHAKFSKKEISVYDEEAKEKIVPYVASEPSQGIERAMLAFLFDAYEDDKKRGNIVLRLHPKLSPVKAGIFPLVNKPELLKLSKQIEKELREDFNVIFDRGGSVGRRYARADEMGIPYCLTVDFDSLGKKDATIRNRNDTKQKRVRIDRLSSVLKDLINGKVRFNDL